jgi:hypothetical protein
VSYDVWLERDGHEVTPDRNYTYNISAMLKLADCQMSVLDGMTGKQAEPILREAILVMTIAPEGFDVLNPPNGWGNREGCVKWLQEIAYDCHHFPRATLRVG